MVIFDLKLFYFLFIYQSFYQYINKYERYKAFSNMNKKYNSSKDPTKRITITTNMESNIHIFLIQKRNKKN